MKPQPNPNKKYGRNGAMGTQSSVEGIGSQHTQTQGSTGSISTNQMGNTNQPSNDAGNGKPRKLMGRIGGARMDKKLTKSFYKEDHPGSNQQPTSTQGSKDDKKSKTPTMTTFGGNGASAKQMSSQ
jgi:hypothetical protein